MRITNHTRPATALGRVETASKFFSVGAEKLYLRGVTYGTFAGPSGYPHPDVVRADFSRMRENGVNAVRIYSSPPRWLLDLAENHGLRVLVGLAWESHVAFLDDFARARAIVERVRADVRADAGHPAVFGYAVGNEIPASIVRWHGARRIERFLQRLRDVVKEEDAQALVTYVNYPSTEYLQLPFLDFQCFNVYLEGEEELDGYLARLQNLAADQPLVLAEIGLDSRSHGEEAQAIVLDWQVRTAFAGGCAGAFIFAWTDEWHRGGHAIDDWDFGLVGRAGDPKPALAAVRDAYRDVPFPRGVEWPRISVVVCSHNGARTLGDCLEALERLDYPDYELIVVDDGSTDATAEVAGDYDVTLIRTENRGLSAARNTGLEAASGEIVAYIDDDAWPDRDWLTYLAAAFVTTPHVGVGGPNIPPRASGVMEAAAAAAPGGPMHVLVSDEEAEHIPGCNSAFRRDRLLEIGGFDAQFRIAGDDVDVCWRLQERGWTLGFCPAALVWHHRRKTLRSYFRQQREYGKAEALLERKWPERYNRGGHPRWAGRLYGGAVARTIGRRWRIYYGTWGGGLFQSVYDRRPGTLASLPLMPEWYLLISVLGLTAAYGFLVEPLVVGVPLLDVPLTFLLLVAAIGALVAHSWRAALRAFPPWSGTLAWRAPRIAFSLTLHALQPLARLVGRLRRGLTPWRTLGTLRLAAPIPRSFTIWSEEWHPLEAWVAALREGARAEGRLATTGGPFERWDLLIRGGMLAGVRVRTAIEEHGHGRQLFRVRAWPRAPGLTFAGIALLSVAAVAPAARGDWIGVAFVALFAVLVAARAFREAAAAMATVRDLVRGDGSALVSPARTKSEGALPDVLMEELRRSRSRKLVLAEREGDA